MTIPYRGTTSSTTYFLTSGTYCKKNLLRSDRMAELFCQKLFCFRDEGRLLLHAFVVMPSHVHLPSSANRSANLDFGASHAIH